MTVKSNSWIDSAAVLSTIVISNCSLRLGTVEGVGDKTGAAVGSGEDGSDDAGGAGELSCDGSVAGGFEFGATDGSIDGSALGSTEATGSIEASGDGLGESDGSALGSVEGVMFGSANGSADGATLSTGEADGSTDGAGVAAESVASSAFTVVGEMTGARVRATKAGWRMFRVREKSDQMATNFLRNLSDLNI